MLLMFEQGTRGSITQTVYQYAWANNKYMNDLFDPGKESHYLQYLDANNRYGQVLSQNLLTGGFRWVENPEKLKGSIIKLAKEVGKGYLLEVGMGYLLEVDVSYPDCLCNQHNDLPFMCEKRKINRVQKLVPNLYNKKRCVIHIAALDQALKHGWSWTRFIKRLSLTKAHG